ncbi:MAG: peptide chain release factor H [Pseudomonadota bacterium]
MSVTLLITSGDGPGECEIAVAKVLERLRIEAEAQDIDMDAAVVEGRSGLLSATVSLDGAGSGAMASTWFGTIQWIAQSPLRPKHRRKNWFVGVHPVDAPPTMPTLDPNDVSLSTLRAGGPGGQQQNTTDSAVRAVHVPTGLAVVARSERSQHRNKARALERLQVLLTLRTVKDIEAHDRSRNRLHHQLERGNPVRVFSGAHFQEIR